MDLIGPYRPIRRLGGGQNSAVFECAGDAGSVAVKHFRFSTRRRKQALRRGRADPVPGWRDAFIWEADLLSTFDHSSIVRVLDRGLTDDQLPYFAMPYYADTVATRLWETNIPQKKAAPLAVEPALRILRDTLSGVGELHRHGVIHRDLKPQNILVGADGAAAICDLGQAISADHGAGQPVKNPGTYPYTAPELRSDPATADHRVDIYAIGLIGHLMLVGELPEDGHTVGDRLPDTEAAAWIAAALNADPSRRPQSATPNF